MKAYSESSVSATARAAPPAGEAMTALFGRAGAYSGEPDGDHTAGAPPLPATMLGARRPCWNDVTARAIGITTFPGLRETQGKYEAVTFAEFAARLAAQPRIVDTAKLKKKRAGGFKQPGNLPLFIAGALEGDSRKEGFEALHISAAVLDIDTGDVDISAIRKAYPFGGVTYSSFNSTAAGRRWRVLLELADDIPAAEWPAAFAALEALGAPHGVKLDTAGRSAKQSYFYPAQRLTADLTTGEPALAPFVCERLEGPVYAAQPAPAAGAPPESLTESPRRPTKNRARAIAGAVKRLANAPPGERNTTLCKSAFLLGGFLGDSLTAQDAENQLYAAIAANGGGDESEERAKIRSSIAAGARKPLPEDGEHEGGEPPPYKLTVDEKGKTHTSAHNVATLLTLGPLSGFLGTNDARGGAIEWVRAAPEIAMGGGAAAGTPYTDGDATHLSAYFSENHGMHAGKSSAINEGVAYAASKFAFNPLTDWLKALAWDGTERLSTWLNVYLGANDDETTRAVGHMWLISAVARAIAPGCQADACLVLQGAQGVGKSTALRILGGDYYAGGIGDLSTKEAAIGLRNSWIVELGELAALKGRDHERIKDFLSKTQDEFRPVFARFPVVTPRRCVFAASTNLGEFLTDYTGSRRYWPVTVAKLDAAALKRDRAQLFAEATARYTRGEAWHPSESTAIDLAAVAENAYAADEWEPLLAERLAPGAFVTITDALDAIGIDPPRRTRSDEGRARAALTRLGWIPAREARGTGRRGFRRP